ncbi:aminopeptidase P family protein [Pseudomonas protegens]|uniref:aminopeptidase P family protein n=1 Tax=Pseudomonas protegens TaxID=380021 RepID=UPI0039060C89
MQMPQTLELRNGEKAPSTFSAEEYARRLRALRSHMAREGLDAALFTSYHNINYYADYLYCSFGRQYALAVTQERTVLISANIDGGQPGRRAICDAQVIYTDWQRGNFLVAVKQALPRASRLGLELDQLSLPQYRALAELYPQAQLLDIAGPCMNLRMLKSAEEQALIRQGARIADLGAAAAIEALHDQVAEYEVALHATQAMVREIARTFPAAELMDTWTWFQSGINTDGAHNPVTSRRVRPGEILSLNCFPMIAGYYTALERTLFLGYCPDAHLLLWEINVKVHQAGLQLIRPGARCSEIARQLNQIYQEHDLLQYRTFGYGHSFGILNHYYGRETGLEFREDVDTMLEPDMVVSMEPMIRLPQGLPGAGGYREHDILIVNAQGAENITALPFGPQHNIIGA